MAHELEELPLFLLNTVLFPYSPLQLHVFEDRYRQMVRECLEFDRPFGVVLIRAGEEVGGPADPYMVGTAVRIVKVQTLDNGRLDLLVKGERRFRVRKIDESKPYLVGFVERVVEIEDEESPRSHAIQTRAREIFQTLIEGVFARQDFNIQVVFPPDPVAISFTMANLLPMDNLEKQRLLEITDTTERFREMIPIIERQILQAKQTNWYRLTPSDLGEWIQPN